MINFNLLILLQYCFLLTDFKIDCVVCTGSDSVEHLKLFNIYRHFHPATHLRLSLLVDATCYPPQLVLIRLFLALFLLFFRSCIL